MAYAVGYFLTPSGLEVLYFRLEALCFVTLRSDAGGLPEDPRPCDFHVVHPPPEAPEPNISACGWR